MGFHPRSAAQLKAMRRKHGLGEFARKRKFISRKIRKHIKEKPQKQAVAIALSEARQKGFKVPKKDNPGKKKDSIWGELW